MKKKIIIIEDQLILNEMLKKAVSNNFEVVAVSNSAKDIPFLCDKYMPDIVLTDILTEEFENGITYGQKIKEKYLDKIKVVAITGLLDITFFEKAKKANLDGFIYKNILPEELISILENIVNGSKIYLNNNCSESNDIKNILTKKELSILTDPILSYDKEFRSLNFYSDRLQQKRCIDLIKYKKLHPEYLITHRYSGLESIGQAFYDMSIKNPDMIKPVVKL